MITKVNSQTRKEDLALGSNRCDIERGIHRDSNTCSKKEVNLPTASGNGEKERIIEKANQHSDKNPTMVLDNKEVNDGDGTQCAVDYESTIKGILDLAQTTTNVVSRTSDKLAKSH